MKPKLDTAANVAVIVVAVVVCFVFIRSYLSTPAHSRSEVRAGDQLQPGPINWGRHNRTLVLAMRVGCEFCEKSSPFYKKLVSMEKDGATDTYIVAALPGNLASTRTFLYSEGLSSIDSVSGVPLDSLKVAGTPTAILVSNNGRVLKVWVGLLSKHGEESLIRAIETKPVAMSH